jgi:type I restriction enzyme S subunit
LRQVQLGSVCEINPRKANGLNPEAQCSFIPMEYVDDYLGAITETSVRQVSEVEKGYKSFQEGDVLFAKITPCMENGKCAIAKNLVNRIGFGSTEFHVIRTQDRIIPEWVYYFLRQEVVRKEAERNMTGSAGQKRVPSKFLAETIIPLPPLHEQKRIAAILSKADRLRRLRRYARELSDGYLGSVFLEMFGDPVANPRGWEITELGNLLRITPHIGTIVPAQEKGDQLCVRVGEIGDWYIDLGACKYVSLTGEDLKRFLLLPGDIVLARAIGSEAHLGKLSIMGYSKMPVVFDSHVMRLRLDDTFILPEFFMLWMRTSGGRARFMQQARRTAVQFNVNAQQMAAIEIPLPPLILQQEFAEIVQKYERLRTQQREAKRQAEYLFQSLLHRVFRGEL